MLFNSEQIELLSFNLFAAVNGVLRWDLNSFGVEISSVFFVLRWENSIWESINFRTSIDAGRWFPMYASPSELGLADNGGTASREDPPSGSNIPTSGAEWVELLVSEVFKASNIEDAKARVSHALEALEKSICVNATSEAAQSFQRDNIMLKQQLEAFVQENSILKRAVSI
ncbi:hypothetical protein ACS0TY_023897 [Phlomoides rotata]